MTHTSVSGYVMVTKDRQALNAIAPYTFRVAENDAQQALLDFHQDQPPNELLKHWRPKEATMTIKLKERP